MSDEEPPWRELVVAGVPRHHLATLSEVLFALGAAGLEEQPPPGERPPPRQPWDTGPAAPAPSRVWVRGWFQGADEDAIDAAVAGVLRLAETTWLDVPDTDWAEAYKLSFPRLVLGAITLAAPWNAEPGDLIVQPGQGFGTGQHPTTAAILRRLPAALAATSTALDVGCGSGVLALAAARAGATAWGIDIDDDAVDNARHNADLNHLDVRFDTTPLAQVPGTFDLVLANLFAERLVAMADDLLRVTGTHLLLAGVLADREDLVRPIYDAALGAPWRLQDGEWVCLHYQR